MKKIHREKTRNKLRVIDPSQLEGDVCG